MSFDRTEQNPEGTGDKTLRELGLTLMYPCFGQEQRIFRLLKVWGAWSDDIKDNVQIILIDDHGTPSVEEMLSGITLYDYNFSVYRIQDDLKYNMPGALNLGMMVASTPWILTMDTDYSFQPDVMQRLLDFKPYQKEVYAFFLERDPVDEQLAKLDRTHTNTFLLHKDTFTSLNGFDEDFSGKGSDGVQPYGFHDNAFIYKLKGAGHVYVQQRGYIATEWKDDVVDQNIEYTAENTKLGKGTYHAKREGKLPFSTDMLRFKWTRVTHHIRGNT